MAAAEAEAIDNASRDENNRPAFFTVPDGDLILRSSDGFELRADAVVLRRASTVFADMVDVAAHGPNSTSREPVDLTETAAILSDILRSLYPTSQRPTFDFSDPHHAIAVLRALDKYAIVSWLLEESATLAIGAVDPPIRAWALAVQAKSDGARAMAVRRFISSTSEVDALDYDTADVPEMSTIDAGALMQLLRVRSWIIPKARSEVENIIRASVLVHYGHENSRPFEEARRRLFDESSLAENLLRAHVLGLAFETDRYCTDCRRHFARLFSTEARERGRSNIRQLMDEAVAKEAGHQVGGV